MLTVHPSLCFLGCWSFTTWVVVRAHVDVGPLSLLGNVPSEHANRNHKKKKNLHHPLPPPQFLLVADHDFSFSLPKKKKNNNNQKKKTKTTIAAAPLEECTGCPFSMAGEEDCCCQPLVQQATRPLQQRITQLEAELAQVQQELLEAKAMKHSRMSPPNDGDEEDEDDETVNDDHNDKHPTCDKNDNKEEENDKENDFNHEESFRQSPHSNASLDLAGKWSVKGTKQRVVPMMNKRRSDSSSSSLTIAEEEFARTDQYMTQVVGADPKYARVRDTCRNQHDMCTAWAYFGECQASPTVMLKQCAPACQSCEALLPQQASDDQDDKELTEQQQPEDPIWEAGDRDRMFTRITKHPYYVSQYQSTIYHSGSRSDPWIIALDNFLTEEECNVLIRYMEQQQCQDGKNNKHQPDQFEQVNDLISALTCANEDYEAPSVISNVQSKLANLTMIPQGNFEELTLFRHEQGEIVVHDGSILYQQDFYVGDVYQPSGPRILSIFLFLHDHDSGGLQFDRLPMGDEQEDNSPIIAPKRGRAVIWPLVRNEDPLRRERNMQYTPLDIDEGTLYGAQVYARLKQYLAAPL